MVKNFLRLVKSKKDHPPGNRRRDPYRAVRDIEKAFEEAAEILLREQMEKRKKNKKKVDNEE